VQMRGLTALVAIVAAGGGTAVLADRGSVLRQGVRRHGASFVNTFMILS
jgi:hypothetical protein